MSKGRVVVWTLAILIGVSFVASGFPKVAPGEGMVRRFAAWGYGPTFATVVGVAELVGGVLLFIPRARSWGVAVISTVMVGAVWTHLRTGVGSPSMAVVYLVALVALALLDRRPSLAPREPTPPRSSPEST